MRYIWKCNKCKSELEVERPMEGSDIPPQEPCYCCAENNWVKEIKPCAFVGPKFKGRYNSYYPK